MSEHFWKGFWVGVVQGAVFIVMPIASFVVGYYTGVWKLLGLVVAP